MPFIDLLKAKHEVFELASERDYRLERLTEAPVWYSISDGSAPLDRAFERLTLGAAPQSCVLTVKGRKVPVSREAAGVARFTFAELCGAAPLGGGLPRHRVMFHTVLLEEVPVLSPAKRNEAARFVTLIDTLYEAKVKLVASAAAEPEQLYPEGDGSFEFQRTVSRLHEMRSIEYMAEAHIVPMDRSKLALARGNREGGNVSRPPMRRENALWLTLRVGFPTGSKYFSVLRKDTVTR